MSLRTRILLILTMVIVIYISLDYTWLRIFILPSFISLEQDEAKKDLLRCAEAITREVDYLDMFCADWAAWDDTYEFITDGNVDYVESNLVEPTFYDNKINLIYFVNTNNEVIWGKIVDFEREETIQVAEFSPDSFAGKHPLLKFEILETPLGDIVLKGIFVTESGPMMISSRPILTSENEGPINGYLIMGRFLSDEVVVNLREQTQVDLRLWPILGKSLPKSDKAYLKNITTKEPVVINEKSRDILHVYTVYYDIWGKSTLLLRADIPRDITARGYLAIHYSQFTIVAVGLLVVLVLMVLIRRGIIEPMSNFTRHVISIGEQVKPTSELPTERTDEIGALAQEFNKMFRQVAKNTLKLESMVEERTAELMKANISLKQEITARTGAEIALKDSNVQLQDQRQALEHKNIALKEVLAQIEQEKQKIKNDVVANVENVLLPTLEKIKMENNAADHQNLDLLGKSLEELTSSYGSKLTNQEAKLAPREIEICNLIRNGLTNKDIAQHLNITLRTVENHRRRIRKKLGLTHQDVNLAVHLQSL